MALHVGRFASSLLVALALCVTLGSDRRVISAQTSPRTPIADLVKKAVIPVYGPAGNPQGVRMLTVASGDSAGGGVGALQLLMGAWEPRGTRVALAVRTSGQTRFFRPADPFADDELVATGYNPFDDIYTDLQLDGQGAPRAYPAGMPERTQRPVTVDGTAY